MSDILIMIPPCPPAQVVLSARLIELHLFRSVSGLIDETLPQPGIPL